MFLFVQKDSDSVKEALNQLGEVGWAKKWSSQPYVSRRTVSLQLNIKLSPYNFSPFNFCVPDITARADKSRNKKRREPCNSQC